MIGFAVVFGLIGFVMFLVTLWLVETTYDTCAKFLCLTAGLCSFGLCITFTSLNVRNSGILRQQKQAIEFGCTPLTSEDIYNTSQKELDSLRKIGGVYFYEPEK